MGNLDIVETAYLKTKNFERLSFLYVITGNLKVCLLPGSLPDPPSSRARCTCPVCTSDCRDNLIGYLEIGRDCPGLSVAHDH